MTEWFGVIRRRKAVTLFAFITTLLVIILSGCTKKIKIPASDSTPPDVRLQAEAPEQKDTVTPSVGPVTRAVGPDAQLYILGAGEDKDGGIKTFFIEGQLLVLCESGTLGQQKPALLYAEAPPPSVPSGYGLTKRVEDMTINIAAWRAECKGNFIAKSVTGWVRASTENFYSGVATTQKYNFYWP